MYDKKAEVEFGLTHKAESPMVWPRKRSFLSPIMLQI